MIEIKQGEQGIYDFSLEISGSISGAPEIRFVIAHPQGYLISFPTIAIENGNSHRAMLPIIDSMLPVGDHPCALEVFFGDRYFKPLFETIRVIETVKVKAAVSKPVAPPIAEPEEAKVTVSAAAFTAAPASPPYEEALAPSEQPVIEEQAEEPVVIVPEPAKPPSEADAGLFGSLLKRKK